MTADLDLMVDMSETNLRRLVRALSKLGYRPKVPVQLEDLVSEKNRRSWQREKGMVVFSVTRGNQDPMELDVMLESPIDFERAYGRRKLLRAGALRISVLSIDDLIVMKRLASREQDPADVNALEDVKSLTPRKRSRR